MRLKVYFDYGSPYAYLAWVRITRVHPDRYVGHEVQWKPVSAGHIFKADGTQPNVRMPNQKRYLEVDARRWAERYGAPFHPPPDGAPGAMPINALGALRLHVVAAQQGREVEAAWMAAVFDAYFGQGRDISDTGVLAALADEVGLDGGAAAAVRDPIKQHLVATTQEAYEAGAPGVPYTIAETEAGPEAFWGNDRLDWVERLLGPSD